jgi:chromate transport protein ChrA
MLIVGQFGLIGLVLAATAIVGPVVRRAIASRRGRETSRSALVMGVVVAMALLDGLLNAFLFLPAIALSGALVMTPGHRHRR